MTGEGAASLSSSQAKASLVASYTIKTLAVKTLANLANYKQFAKAFYAKLPAVLKVFTTNIFTVWYKNL